MIKRCLIGIFLILGMIGSVVTPIWSAEKLETTPYGLDTAVKVWKGDLDGMVKRRIIRVLVVYNRTFYFLDKGRQRGASYDALKEFEKNLNLNVKDKSRHVHMVFIPTSREEGLKALLEGRADMAAAGIKILPEFKDRIDFSKPIIKGVNEIVVTAPSVGKLSDLNSLSGKKVYVRKKSAYTLSLKKLNQTFKQKGRKPVIIEELPNNLEDEDILEMVNADLIPITIVDEYLVKFWKQVHSKINLYPDFILRKGADIGWVFRKNTPKLQTKANEFINSHGKGTLFGNIIFKRYLKNTQYVQNALSKNERNKFLAMVDLFTKYGERYGFDQLLMMAQGYQESRLDQSVKSHVGAVGVMQLLPSTGKSMKVGDIGKLEPNIHAGIKYMRFMMDHYFADAQMDRLNRGLLALASYNAGPTAISKYRKEAAKKGLNPNVWFNNVERVVAKRVGQEPVRYVANIYKYYIAYKLFMEQRKARNQTKEAIDQ